MLFAAVVLVGVGCFRVAPRVVQDDGGRTVATEPAVHPLAVVALDGVGTLTRDGQTFDLKDGLEVMPGDTVMATAGSVILVYPHTGASTLAPGTTVTLLPDNEGLTGVFAHIELTVGSIWTRFERLLEMDERFSVNANNVVATVRGTAFGIESVDGEAEVQVADSEVEVSLLDARKDPSVAASSVRLTAGRAIRVGADALKRLDAAAVSNRIRTLTVQERARAEYRFIARPVDSAILAKTASVRIDLPPSIPEGLRDRVDPTLLQRILLLRDRYVEPTFVSPYRSIQPSDQAPPETPSDTATSSGTVQPTSQYDGLNLLGETVE